MVNTPYLEEKIKQSGKRKAYLADKCGCSIQSLRLKITGKYDFTTSQVQVLCKELGVTSPKEMEKIFFKV